MATTENVTQRIKNTINEPKLNVTDSTNNNNDKNKGTKQKRTGTMARRGLKTLILAVAFPATLHLTTLLTAHRASPGPAHLWILHAMSIGSGSLMGLCAWLVWAEGGFHKQPMSLCLFLGYLVLSLVWDRVGPVGSWAGLVVSLGMFGAVTGCCVVFKKVNPIAGDLAKLGLVWAGLAVALNIKLLCW